MVDCVNKKMIIDVLFIGFLGLTSVLSQVPPFTEKCESGLYPPDSNWSIPTYVVNLDLPGEERWTEVMKDRGPQIRHLLSMFKQFIRDFGNRTEKIIKFVDTNGEKMVSTLPYADEMRGIANATGLPLGEVVFYNVFYELFTFCTSIVAQDSSGKLFHARNLDFGLFLGWDVKTDSWTITEALRHTIVNIDFRRNNKTVFKSVHFAGYLGVLTGVKPGVFTLTMNERFNIDGGFMGVIEWILGDHSGQWMGFLTRQTLENSHSFEEAKKNLTNTKMLAPAYFILGGTKPGEGCVITRARESAVDVWCMNSSMWYILETNYDHWQKPLFLDDRRTPAHKCMNTLTQKKVSVAGIFDVLSSKPVLNKLTTYTALMQVDSGHLETWIQACEEPCFPW
ncbi:acid ceramidase-like [Liolophura sinensis]|uniref:acid ceramidase-like n=1 Tax=Liolophura sinensis TaxID=3198878 RepID=UPI003158DE19